MTSTCLSPQHPQWMAKAEADLQAAIDDGIFEQSRHLDLLPDQAFTVFGEGQHGPRSPRALGTGTILGSPASQIAMTELVVPRSVSSAFAMEGSLPRSALA